MRLNKSVQKYQGYLLLALDWRQYQSQVETFIIDDQGNIGDNLVDPVFEKLKDREVQEESHTDTNDEDHEANSTPKNEVPVKEKTEDHEDARPTS